LRILQITKKFPYPAKDGEVIAILNAIKGFKSLGHDIKTLSLNTVKHHFDVATLPEHIKQLADFEALEIDTSIKAADAFFNLFTDKSYNIERFFSYEFEEAIAQNLSAEKFDVVFLEGIYLMRYIDVIRKNTHAKVVLRLHNVEYIIWERLARETTNPIKRFYLNLLVKRLKHFELSNINHADSVIAVSKEDEDLFKNNGLTKPSVTIPIGYDLVRNENVDFSKEKSNSVCFIGSMDWMPNYEGIQWFLSDVWKLITAQIPNAQFFLAGRSFPDTLLNWKQKGVKVLGEIDDAQAFILSNPVFVVPLFAGSGMRVKVIEAMALGRAVVATYIGAESIHYTDGKNILIADDKVAFANAVVRILNDSNLRNQIGHHAQELIRNEYENNLCCKRMIQFIEGETA